MKRIFILFLGLIITFPVFSQGGFQFENDTDKVSVPFKLINNLIFIPIKVNGVELNFLLDTGVEETILFSMDDKKEVSFFNVEKVSLRGLGSENAIEGLKSTNNKLEVHGLKSVNHLLYIILDQDFNLSSHIGIPVNGIIGYHFFKNNLVDINYERRRIVIQKNAAKTIKKLENKFEAVPITIEKFKPYIMSNLVVGAKEYPAKLLIDIGNSDAVWIFQNKLTALKVPAKNFEDFLGKGFSGDVEGKRARISKFQISKFEFINPIVAFPDSSSIKNVRMVPGRVGSVGGEVLKRFRVVFDYSNGLLYLKKNKDHSHFNYNKSGVEIRHNGLQWVQETVHLETVPLSGTTFDSGGNKSSNDFKYKFQLKPVYEIANIRKNSPAANCGLQVGDIIITINKKTVFRYSLEEINFLFKSEEEKKITLEVERNNQILKFSFQLLDVL
jgi:hypothetical protein